MRGRWTEVGCALAQARGDKQGRAEVLGRERGGRRGGVLLVRSGNKFRSVSLSCVPALVSLRFPTWGQNVALWNQKGLSQTVCVYGP